MWPKYETKKHIQLRKVTCTDFGPKFKIEALALVSSCIKKPIMGKLKTAEFSELSLLV